MSGVKNEGSEQRVNNRSVADNNPFVRARIVAKTAKTLPAGQKASPPKEAASRGGASSLRAASSTREKAAARGASSTRETSSLKAATGSAASVRSATTARTGSSTRSREPTPSISAPSRTSSSTRSRASTLSLSTRTAPRSVMQSMEGLDAKVEARNNSETKDNSRGSRSRSNTLDTESVATTASRIKPRRSVDKKESMRSTNPRMITARRNLKDDTKTYEDDTKTYEDDTKPYEDDTKPYEENTKPYEDDTKTKEDDSNVNADVTIKGFCNVQDLNPSDVEQNVDKKFSKQIESRKVSNSSAIEVDIENFPKKAVKEPIRTKERVRQGSVSSNESLVTSQVRRVSKMSDTSADSIQLFDSHISEISFSQSKVGCSDGEGSSTESGIETLDGSIVDPVGSPVDPISRVFTDKENIGFGLLPQQVSKKAAKKGFEFTLMVVGESGLGKSTLVNSMFLTNIYSSQRQPLQTSLGQTLQVETHGISLEEKGVKLNLTVVDTPGFGDSVDNSNCWRPIVQYIDDQFEQYYEEENAVNRAGLTRDSRVHVCLYFIAPTGHGLKPLDIEFMRTIQTKVNIVPVIGKSDSCTHQEIHNFKKKVLNQLYDMKIETYDFPASELAKDDLWMRERIPFAVVGSNTLIKTDNGLVRGREYSWGTVSIENKDHCDFIPLRSLLLSHHMQDLRERTHICHYEMYRTNKLTSMPYLPPSQSLPGLLNSFQNDESAWAQPGDQEDVQSEHQDQTQHKKSWILKWNRGKVDLERRYLPNGVFNFKMPARVSSLSMADLRLKTNQRITKTTNNINNNKKFRSLVRTLNEKKVQLKNQTLRRKSFKEETAVPSSE